jgi:hypothetical protein
VSSGFISFPAVTADPVLQPSGLGRAEGAFKKIVDGLPAVLGQIAGAGA